MPGPGPFHRLLFAAISLLAGDIALLFLLFPGALGLFPMYALFSILGWLLVGVPFVLAFPARLLSRVAWPLCLLIGALLGPLALLLIFVVLSALQGTLGKFSLDHTETLWPFSILVSTVSFLVYAVLLRRQLPKTEPVGQ
jgi:hypothetical protein